MIFKQPDLLFTCFFLLFRGVFKKAREDTRSNFHVYVAAALMEYYCSKVGSKIEITRITGVILLENFLPTNKYFRLG